MTYAGFSNIEEARRHRERHGGWIFVPEAGEPIWFALGSTPTAILTHPATRGMNGSLT